MAFNPRAPRVQDIGDPPPRGGAAQPTPTPAPAAAPSAQPAASPSAQPTAPVAPTAGQNAWRDPVFDAILSSASKLGRPITTGDLYQIGSGMSLGPVTAIRPAGTDDGFGISGGPTLRVEYANGFILYLKGSLGNDGEITTSGDAGSAVSGFGHTATVQKTQAQIDAEVKLQNAQTTAAEASSKASDANAALAAANAAKQAALNAGGAADKDLAQLQANIDGAKAQADLANANSKRVSAELAANTPAIAAAATQAGAEAGLQNANSNSQSAATGQARLGLDAAIAENDRKFKEGQIDNETHRIVANWLIEQWKSDNTNTQTVVDAAKTGYNGQETDANRDATIANARLNAANQGFSDDARTTGDLATWMMPGSTGAGDLFMGLQGLREATAKRWGGMKDVAHPDQPGVINQLGYNTPIAMQSLGDPASVEAQAQAIKAGRGMGSSTVTAPTVTPGTKPTLTVPTAPAAAPGVKPNVPAPGVARPATGPGSPAAQGTPYTPPMVNGVPTINPATGDPTGLPTGTSPQPVDQSNGLPPGQSVRPVTPQADGNERDDDILTFQYPGMDPLQLRRDQYNKSPDLWKDWHLTNAEANPQRPDMQPLGSPAPPPEPAYAPLSSIPTPSYNDAASQGNLDQSNRMLVAASGPYRSPYDQGGRPRGPMALHDLFMKKAPMHASHASVPMAIIDIRPHR